MAYITNGIARTLKLTIKKNIGGVPEQGYPKVYNGQNSWGDPLYITLTDQDLQRLSDFEFSARLTAFKAYVESVEPGLDIDTDLTGDGFTKQEPSCDPPTTTTTTTAAPTTTTTTTTAFLVGSYTFNSTANCGGFLYPRLVGAFNPNIIATMSSGAYTYSDMEYIEIITYSSDNADLEIWYNGVEIQAGDKIYNNGNSSFQYGLVYEQQITEAFATRTASLTVRFKLLNGLVSNIEDVTLRQMACS